MNFHSQLAFYSVCNWPYLESFSVQLSRCKVATFQGSNPEDDTDFRNALFNSDPLRRRASCATCPPAFALAFSCFAACAASLTDVVLLNGHPHRPWNELPCFHFHCLPRKEVIQPHLPIRLPCYDFTPVIGLALGGWLLAVASPTLGTPNSHGVTGGVYKARERIHRGMLIRDY